MERGPCQDEGPVNSLDWSTVGLGLHHAAVAYNGHIVSVLGFLAQLAWLPPEWSQAEPASTLQLVPGPAQWIIPKDLHQVKERLGMPAAFAEKHACRVAVKCRNRCGGSTVAMNPLPRCFAEAVGGIGFCSPSTTTWMVLFVNAPPRVSPWPQSSTNCLAGNRCRLRSRWRRKLSIPFRRPSAVDDLHWALAPETRPVHGTSWISGRSLFFRGRGLNELCTCSIG